MRLRETFWNGPGNCTRTAHNVSRTARARARNLLTNLDRSVTLGDGLAADPRLFPPLRVQPSLEAAVVGGHNLCMTVRN